MNLMEGRTSSWITMLVRVVVNHEEVTVAHSLINHKELIVAHILFIHKILSTDHW